MRDETRHETVRWCARWCVRTVVPRRLLRVDRADLDRLIQRCRVGPDGAP